MIEPNFSKQNVVQTITLPWQICFPFWASISLSWDNEVHIPCFSLVVSLTTKIIGSGDPLIQGSVPVFTYSTIDIGVHVNSGVWLRNPMYNKERYTSLSLKISASFPQISFLLLPTWLESFRSLHASISFDHPIAFRESRFFLLWSLSTDNPTTEH